MSMTISLDRRKCRIERAGNGWVVIRTEGNNPQGEKLVFTTWQEVWDACTEWLNPDHKQ